MARNDKKNQLSLGKIIGALVLFALLDSDLAGPVLLMVIPLGIFWVVFRSIVKAGKRNNTRSRTARPRPLDDCPKPICLHKDKGMHHVIRGRGQDPWDLPSREIDPWDRPDIDISKYQRR